MADKLDRASEYEQAARDEAIARARAAAVHAYRVPKFCDHCEESPRASSSVNCARCDLELAG